MLFKWETVIDILMYLEVSSKSSAVINAHHYIVFVENPTLGWVRQRILMK